MGLLGELAVSAGLFVTSLVTMGVAKHVGEKAVPKLIDAGEKFITKCVENAPKAIEKTAEAVETVTDATK